MNIRRSVETKEDIEKQIEIEAAHLMYFEYKKKEEAFKEAKQYIETKYQSVVDSLKAQGQY